MSEEEKKEKRKPKVISYIAILTHVATIMACFVSVSMVLWSNKENADIATNIFLTDIDRIMRVFWPIPLIGLVLSIITLYTERNERYRLLTQALGLFGIWLYASCVYVFCFS